MYPCRPTPAIPTARRDASRCSAQSKSAAQSVLGATLPSHMVSRLVRRDTHVLSSIGGNSGGGHLRTHAGPPGGEGGPAPVTSQSAEPRRGLSRSVVRCCEPLARTISSAPAELEVAEKPCQARAVMLSACARLRLSKNWVRAGGTRNFVHRDQGRAV